MVALAGSDPASAAFHAAANPSQLESHRVGKQGLEPRLPGPRPGALTLTPHPGGEGGNQTRRRDKLRIVTGRSWRLSMDFRIGKLNSFITGWMPYFGLAASEPVFRSLDGWLRRRLRQVRWKEGKSTAAKRHNLRIRGISESS